MLRITCLVSSALLLGACVVVPAVAWAQFASTPDVVFVARPTRECPMGAPFDRAVAGPDARGSQAKPMENAPYAGVGTTEVVQTLPDGNRIVRTNTMRYYRDSKGRTRTEHALAAVGPFTLEETRSIIMIEDPVAGRHFVLHPELKRANELKLRTHSVVSVADGPVVGVAGGPVAVFGSTESTTKAEGGSVNDAAVAAAVPSLSASRPVAPTAGAPGARIMMTPGGSGMCDPDSVRTKAPTTVSLGERTIEGVKTIGSRYEFVIAAGVIGNEQPITVRSEQWFSPELGVVVESKHSDPLVGDTTYRLTQIRREEPDASLFAVPADYTTESIAAPVMGYSKFKATAPR